MGIVRKHSGNRMSKIVIHNGVVYLSGQVPDDKSPNIKDQTKDVLKKIEALLKEAKTDKSKLLTAQIIVRDIDNHFAPMNDAWDEWIGGSNSPVRMCTEAKMSTPQTLVEILVTAAV